MFNVLADLQSSIRVFRRRPVVTLVCTVILVLGLSSTVTVFNYVNTFSQTFPGVEHKRLVRIFGVEEGNPYLDISLPDFVDYAAAGDNIFEEIAAVAPYYAASVRRENVTEVGLVEAASGAYFSLLGIETSIGRGLGTADDQPTAPPVAVLSHSWWLRSFNGDPSALVRLFFSISSRLPSWVLPLRSSSVLPPTSDRTCGFQSLRSAAGTGRTELMTGTCRSCECMDA